MRRSPQGYTPLYLSFESFYIRNVYRRMSACFNNPLESCPGGQIDIQLRETPDYGFSYRWVGSGRALSWPPGANRAGGLGAQPRRLDSLLLRGRAAPLLGLSSGMSSFARLKRETRCLKAKGLFQISGSTN